MTSLSDKIDLPDLEQLLLAPLSQSELLQELRLLQQIFTRGRDSNDFLAYASDPKKVSAYTAFYLPTNIPKWDYLWSKLSQSLKEKIAQCDFIDFGSGPGTYSLAMLESLRGQFQGRVVLVDTSEVMLEQGRKILGHFHPEVEVHSCSPQELSGAMAGERRERTLFFGHSLNEMPNKVRWQLLKKISPDHLLWIEPGTPAVFKELLPLRELLLGEGYRVLYPCLQGGSCPLKDGHENEWCHQVIHTSLPPEVARLAQILKLNRHELPMMAHAYSRVVETKPYKELQGRILRVRKETKHSLEWDLCLGMNGELCWTKVSIPKKSMSKSLLKDRLEWMAGDQARIKPIKELAAHTLRVELQDE